MRSAFEIVFYLFTAGVALWGVSGQCGLRDGKLHPISFCYYTTLSNLLAALYQLLLAVAIALGSSGLLSFLRLAEVHLCVALSILLTFLVYHFLLWPAESKRQSHRPSAAQLWDNRCVHYLSPLLTLLGWLLFAQKSGLSYGDAALWLLFPLAYLAFALVRAHIGPPFYPDGPRYPYAFMDFDKLGPKRALTNCALMFAAGYGLGCLFVAFAGLIA